MSTTEWQRQLLATLSQLAKSNSGIRGDIAGMRGDIAELRKGQDEIRSDMRTLTRVIVRRFGTAGTSSPQIGDHVLFHVRPDVVRPAVVLEVHEDRLDLEVFGAGLGARERLRQRVPPGSTPGCWSFPI